METVRNPKLKHATVKVVRDIFPLYTVQFYHLHIFYSTNTKSCLSAETTDTLIDLAGSDTPSPPHPVAHPPQPFATIDPVSPIPVLLPPPAKQLGDSYGSQTYSPSHPPGDKASASLSLLDDELLSLGTIFKFSVN